MRDRFGPLLCGSDTLFRLWAPDAEAVELCLAGGAVLPMARAEDGFHTVVASGCGPGARYCFRTGGLSFPDPASRRQDGGVDGWSVVSAPLPPPRTTHARRPWHETVCCEVHVGTATPEGTFAGLMARLEHFRDAGYTAIELMPVNAFAGSRGWGYDGTLIFAPEPAYGTPEELRALVDRAHDLGLGVLLDVVYNHFGDVGNFLSAYAPSWFDQGADTPWGAAVDFTRGAVRAFYCENACMWLAGYDLDGLRFDAIHEIRTAGRERFLRELAAVCRAVKPDAALIVENAERLARWLDRDADGRPLTYTAQWNDDLGHALHYLATGERRRGYSGAGSDAIADLEKALADGFVHDGEAAGPSDGRTRNEPASRLPPEAFVSFVINHDQIGNRADAARLPTRTSPEQLDFLYFMLFLCPQLPLFFMGDEAHVHTPFPYFIDLPEDVAERRRQGRDRQMRCDFEEEVPPEGLPDPNDPATFAMARLEWSDLASPAGRAALERFRTFAAWRRQLVWPLTATARRGSVSARQGEGIIVTWTYAAGDLSMALNPTADPAELDCVLTGMPVAAGSWRAHGKTLHLGPWSALAWRS